MHPTSSPRRAMACLALLLSVLLPAAATAGAAPAPTALAATVADPLPAPGSAAADPGGILADRPGFGSGSARNLLRRQLGRLPLSPHVTRRHALAVITDFADSRLEDWRGPGFNNTAEVRHTLDEMEAHWEWLSQHKENMDWDIIRVTLPARLSPDAYPGWVEFREAVAAQIRQKVNVADYDANHDGIIDSAWVIASSKDADYGYLIGGTSSNGGVNLFVDGQASLSVRVDAYGNFNHELGHTLGLPDLYGPYDTVHYLTLMSDSWPVPPNSFTAYERYQLGWSTPDTLAPGRHSVRLRNANESLDAARIPTGRPNEYFLVEYRKRPDSGFGSSAPWHDGLAVYHVLEDSSTWIDPPIVKLVAADGAIAPDQAPQPEDFFHPDNHAMKLPMTLRSYAADLPVARIEQVQRAGDDLRLVVTVLPPLAGALGNLVLRNRLQNPSFEQGNPLPLDWTPDSWIGRSVFDLDSGVAYQGRRSARITNPVPEDGRYMQTVGGLTPGRAYQLCGQLRGEDITLAEGPVGGNVSEMYTYTHSRGLSGSFDWTPACVVSQPRQPTMTYACRLGFYGSTVTGKLWCDSMSLVPLNSAFAVPE